MNASSGAALPVATPGQSFGYCSRCGTAYTVTTAFCSRCGKPVAASALAYGGLARRAVAAVIDLCLAFTLIGLFDAIVFGFNFDWFSGTE